MELTLPSQKSAPAPHGPIPPISVLPKKSLFSVARGYARAHSGTAAPSPLRDSQAKLAPKDRGIRRELTAAKERLAATEAAPPAGTLAVAAALASGGLYPEETSMTPSERIDRALGEGARMCSQGPSRAKSAQQSVPGSWGKAMRGAARNKES